MRFYWYGMYSDIEPHNILYTLDVRASRRLIIGGLTAKNLDDEAERALGLPQYMSPFQIRLSKESKQKYKSHDKTWCHMDVRQIVIRPHVSNTGIHVMKESSAANQKQPEALI